MDAQAVHARSAVPGQEGGVDVEDAVGEGVQRGRADLLHVAGGDDQFDAVLVQGVEHGPVQLGRIGVGAAGEVNGGYSEFAGVGQGTGRAVVADDQGDRELASGLPGRAGQRAEVGSGVRGEDCDLERHDPIMAGPAEPAPGRFGPAPARPANGALR